MCSQKKVKQFYVLEIDYLAAHIIEYCTENSTYS